MLYYNALVDNSNNTKLKIIFTITNDQIEYILPRICDGFFSFDATKLMSLLNALYYFAQYLHECKNYNKNQRDDLINRIKELHNMHYDYLCKVQIISLAFEKFSLFG